MTSQTPLFNPADFRMPTGTVHLAAAGESPFLLRHDAAMLQYATEKGSGMPARKAEALQVEDARLRAAALFGVDRSSIGFVPSVADGMTQFAGSVTWPNGSNVCVDAAEFPSVALPMTSLRSRGVEIRVARGDAPDRLVSLIDGETRAVVVSSVSWLTGERYDLSALRDATDTVGAYLVVDFTQSAGAMPVDAKDCDFAFAASYKFLLGTTGTAIAFWNEKRRPDWQPPSAGWNTVPFEHLPEGVDLDKPPGLKSGGQRFTYGNPAHLAIYVLNSSLTYLSMWPATVVAGHIELLTTRLIGGLEDRSIPTLTPVEPTRRGPSVSIPSGDAAALMQRLEALSILVWNGFGRIRVSLHGYNGTDDVDRLLAALEKEWRG